MLTLWSGITFPSLEYIIFQNYYALRAIPNMNAATELRECKWLRIPFGHRLYVGTANVLIHTHTE